MLGGVLRLALAVLTIPLLIRLIGTDNYGVWTLVSAVVGVVALAEGGLSVSTTVFASRDLAQEDLASLSQTLTVTLGGIVTLATLAGVIIWLSADSISGCFHKLGPPEQKVMATALKLSGLVVWARLLQQVLVGLEQAYQRYGLLNIVNTLQQALSGPGLLLIAVMGGRIVAFMQWQVVVSMAALLAH